MRLFTAVLPPAEVLDHLEAALTSVRGPADPDDARSPLRWTLPADRHLTLAFYGDVPEGYLDEVTDGLRIAVGSQAQLELALRGAGSFDRRTLWVGCGGQSEALSRLTASCADVGARVLGRYDDRPHSRAHLTVARVRPGARTRPARYRRDGPENGLRTARGASDATGLADLAHALAVYQGPTWLDRDVALVRSSLGAGPAGHPRHEVVERFALQAVAG